MQHESLLSVLFKNFFRFILILCLIFLILQFDSLEKRIVNVEKKLTTSSQTVENIKLTLNDTKKMMSNRSIVSNNSNASIQNDPNNYGDVFRNPELPNLLVEDPYVMTAPEAELNGKLTRWFGGDPAGLNPITVNAADVSQNVTEYIIDNLGRTHYHDPDKYAPAVAYRAEMSDDGKCFTFYLRRNVKWHTPLVDWSNPQYNWLKGDHFVTAHDFVFHYNTLMNPQVEASHSRNYYEDIESVKALTDHILEIKWKKKLYNAKSLSLSFTPTPEFIYAYNSNGERFSKETFGLKFNDHWYNNKAIGNGRYEFISWKRGEKITLKRFEEYYGEKPAIKDITYLIFTDRNQTLLKIKSNEIDCAELTIPQWKKHIQEGVKDGKFKCTQDPNGPIEHKVYDYMGYSYIGWNSEKILFSDKRVRRAMTLALPRRKMLKNLWQDMGSITSGPFFFHSPAYDKSIKPLEFNLEEAAKLLDEAGWTDSDKDGIRDKVINGEKINFDFPLLVWGSSTDYQTLCKVFKEKLYELGIRMTIQAVDWAVMQKKMKDRDFYGYTGGWALSWSSDPFQLWHSSQAIAGGSNYVSFKNAEADKIIEQLRVEFDEPTRIKLYHEFHKIIYENQPYTFFKAHKSVFSYWDHIKRMEIRKARPHTVSYPWYIER